MGYVPLAEIYEVIHNSRANRGRMRIRGPTSGVEPRALVSFFQDGQVTLLYHRKEKEGRRILDAMDDAGY
jgi:hypothetical protein